MLVVVDDSDSEVRDSNRKTVERLEAHGIKTVYLKNGRTSGAAGAWNTALSYLQATAPSAFVAILDDDDSWDPEYLRLCEKTVSSRGLDMTASGIVYHGSAAMKEMLLDPPDDLVADDLLVRNTNIQGSNMFVRLRRMLEAGGFDESLASTTDRDVCIRLADMRTIRYSALAGHLVHHYAEDDRPRLSTPGSLKKCAGLDYFFRKHRGRMSEIQKSAFLTRGRDLFGYVHSEAPQASQTVLQFQDCGRAGDVLDLVVGVITSPDVGLVSSLMDSLVYKIGSRGDVGLKVVLLENGGREPRTRNSLREAVKQASELGLDVSLITLEQQVADAAACAFVAPGDHLAERKSIALSRTILQHYLFLEAATREDAVVWILDDDVVLESLECGADGLVMAQDIDYVSGIKRLRKMGADVVLCQETGDPPLPALSCMRTQMVDLYHNLLRMARLRPDDPYPNAHGENRTSRSTRRNYYYDLSGAETDHLELPFWYEADGNGGVKTGQAFREMVSRLPGILDGIQVFRPLTRNVFGDRAPHANTVDTINRGPATLVFDIRALRDFPNAAPSIGGADTRRSDMVWSLLNRFAGGRKVMQSDLPVRQVRQVHVDPSLDVGCLLQDIRGHALYSSLQNAFACKVHLSRKEKGREEPCGKTLLNFDEREIERAVGSYRRYARKRAHSFELNFIRIMGLLSALKPLCGLDPAAGPAPWWLESSEYATHVRNLQKFIEFLCSFYTTDQLDDFRRRATDIDASAVGRFIANLPGIVDTYRSGTPLPKDALRRSAIAYVRAEFATGPLTYLGMGEEGIVLTDGHLAYKHFYCWGLQENRKRATAFLRSLAGKLSGYRTLPDLLEVREKDGHAVVVYTYERGRRYNGGHQDGLITLLLECRRAGLACSNIHPDNLLVTSSGLKFIDYGADIVQANVAEFEQMCRRAFLACRFAFRPDLRRLMTRALYDHDLVELTGLEQFRNALDPRGLDTLFYRPMEQLIVSRRPSSVLDYGCGDGRLSERLAHAGAKVTGYDPDPVCIEGCRRRDGAATYGSTELRRALLVGSARFDAVVCSRVICTITDSAEFEGVLRNLRQLVTDSGDIFVAVCNPFYLDTTSMELAEKHLPENFRYENTFNYIKTVRSTGNQRTEMHRSYDTYRWAFAKVGLSVRDARELAGTDTRALLPASEHLVFRLCPMSASNVSLLIKTCLPEWRVIERLVRHQVRQLEGPATFAEKVVVVDPSEGPFLRQYAPTNAKAHRAAMERLLRDGVVDKVVYAQPDKDTMHSTYLKWFGVESAETHSAGGQQLFATLFGFDSCTGDYVLQLDSDLLIARTDRNHDYLAEMENVLRGDPNALFVSMNICRTEATPHTASGPDGDWRVEVRGCLFDRRRLESVLPVPNEPDGERFKMSWHRAFDRFMRDGGYRSYRGGRLGTSFIHVPNTRKPDVSEWMDIVGAVERGHVPEAQMGIVDLAGSAADWAGPHRSESFVFVICGRNVPRGRFKRCFDSVMAQQQHDGSEWGAVVIDDASTDGFGDYAEMLLADHADRVTLIRNESRRGTLYNTWYAVTKVCINPETVIVTLDADDSLAGSRVLERVRAEYDTGADATVGSMLRSDKNVSYPANLYSPRRWDGNVWQHLRTFKKRLFDAIAVEDLKLDGKWISIATDWAFMIPIIEMASSPRYIPDRLYLHEPTTQRDEDGRRERDNVIRRILSKTPYAKLEYAACLRPHAQASRMDG